MRNCKPSIAKVHPVFNFMSWVYLVILFVVAACTGAQALDMYMYTMTNCTPIAYSSNIGICTASQEEWQIQYPVQAWVKYAYYDPQIGYTTIQFQNICGYSLEGAIANAKAKYPQGVVIPCGIKTWQYWPITFFQNGLPFNQFPIFAACASLFVVYGIIYLCVISCECCNCCPSYPYMPIN